MYETVAAVAEAVAFILRFFLFFVCFLGCVCGCRQSTHTVDTQHQPSASQREYATMWCACVCIFVRALVQEHTHPKIKLQSIFVSVEYTTHMKRRLPYDFLIYFLVLQMLLLLLLLLVCSLPSSQCLLSTIFVSKMFFDHKIWSLHELHISLQRIKKQNSTQLFTIHISTKKKKIWKSPISFDLDHILFHFCCFSPWQFHWNFAFIPICYTIEHKTQHTTRWP